MAEKVKIYKSQAYSLMKYFQWKTLDNWNSEKFTARLPGIKEVAKPTETPSEDVAKTMITVFAAFEEGKEVQVVDDPVEGVVKTEKTENEEKKKEEKEKTPEPKVEKPKKEPKAPEPKKEKVGPGGLRITKTRETIAGRIIKEVGLEVGITAKMIDDVDAEYGKPNKDRSWSALISAWHTINGYTGQYPVADRSPVSEEPKEEAKKVEEQPAATTEGQKVEEQVAAG